MATIQWFPGHMAKALRQIREQMPLVDILFELVDARVPYSSQNPEVALAAGEKPKLLIMTKTDLADQKRLNEWIKYFEQHNQPVLALDSRQNNVAKVVTARSKEILKVKKFEDADVLVTDILEGEGRLEGKLGKIEIQFKYKGKIHTNYIGSGFNDDEREYYWKHKEELIGKVITIKYFELSKNEKGGIGFRFGTWKGSEYIRNDKEGIDDTNV